MLKITNLNILGFNDYIQEKLSATMQYTEYPDGTTETGSSIDKQPRSFTITKDIPIHKLMPYEPYQEKVKNPHSSQTVDSLVKTIKAGNRKSIPPITVMKHPIIPGSYIILDGHHRYFSHLKAGSKVANVEIVPDHNMSYDT